MSPMPSATSRERIAHPPTDALDLPTILRTTGDPRESERFTRFYNRVAPIARHLFPTVTEPLQSRSAVRAGLDDDALLQDPLRRSHVPDFVLQHPRQRTSRL